MVGSACTDSAVNLEEWGVATRQHEGCTGQNQLAVHAHKGLIHVDRKGVWPAMRRQ